MSDLRARGKARRRAEVVAAAAELWRRHGVESVQIAQISEAAEVATQTVYNLFGGLDALVFAVIEALLDRLDVALAAAPMETGVDRSLRCVRVSADMFCSESELYRQLVVRIPKAMFDGAHYVRDSAQIQIAAIRAAQVEGDLDAAVSPEALGRQIFIGYMGALYAWACGGLEDAAFRRAAELAALLPLTSCATPQAQARLQARVREFLSVDQQARASHA